MRHRERLVTTFEPGLTNEAAYPSAFRPNDRWDAVLDPHHSHHVLVETGWERSADSKSGPWGREGDLRAALAK